MERQGERGLMAITDSFAGKTALVTGAGSGIGKGIARALLERGVRVTSLEIAPANIASAAKELGHEDQLAWHEGSVARAADVEAAFALAKERFGTVDFLVNNAGVAALSLIENMAEEEWDLIVDTCLKGTFLCTKAFARQAIAAKRGGAIVNIASLNSVAATDGLAHYCAAKAGIMQFTQVTAGELGRHGIRANSIGPGTVNTPLGEPFTHGLIGQAFLDRTLVGPEARHQEPSDVADVTMFLLSPAAQRITGHFIPVDGGQHVRGLHSYWDVAEKQGLVSRP
jgi:3-oxoacyl-[acyl-carrier protein] reductase